jgi:hypothetical protein
MKVFFVGLHNKPHKTPLCSSTKSGKLIDRIINQVFNRNGVDGAKWVKTNLFDVDFYPTNDDENWGRATEWWERNKDVEETDLIVLLGAAVHRDFVNCPYHVHILEVAHPASKRSHVDMNEYVYDVSAKIREHLQSKIPQQ